MSRSLESNDSKRARVYTWTKELTEGPVTPSTMQLALEDAKEVLDFLKVPSTLQQSVINKLEAAGVASVSKLLKHARLVS